MTSFGVHVDVQGLKGVSGVSLCRMALELDVGLDVLSGRTDCSHFEAIWAFFAFRDRSFENESLFLGVVEAVL